MPSPGMLCSVVQLLVIAKVVSSSPILATLMIEVISSTETSVLTRGTRRHIPLDGILYNVTISEEKIEVPTKNMQKPPPRIKLRSIIF
jgi:hypothetical protein